MSMPNWSFTVGDVNDQAITVSADRRISYPDKFCVSLTYSGDGTWLSVTEARLLANALLNMADGVERANEE